MKNNITEIVFILDRSGSMGGLESDTIGGFNSMLRKQKERRSFPPYSSTTRAWFSTTGSRSRRCPR